MCEIGEGQEGERKKERLIYVCIFVKDSVSESRALFFCICVSESVCVSVQ